MTTVCDNKNGCDQQYKVKKRKKTVKDFFVMNTKLFWDFLFIGDIFYQEEETRTNKKL